MKTCIVGSRSLVLDGNVAIHLLYTLQELYEHDRRERVGPDVTSILARPERVILRQPLHLPVRPFEALTSTLAESLGLGVDWFAPEPGGRAKVFLRDVEMVQAADQVIAFFPDGDEMTGGTGHVVEKALDQKKPVRAYAVAGTELRLIGSEDWSEG